MNASIHPPISDQSIAFKRNRILTIMTSTTLPVVLRRLRYDQRDLNRIAQSDQSVGKFCRSIKRFDLVPQVTQFANRARETIATAHQSDVVPHDVLNRLHVTLNQRRIGISAQAALVPRRDVVKTWFALAVGLIQGALYLDRDTISPDQPFEQRSRGETVRAVHARTTDLADGVQIFNRRSRPLINQDAAAKVVRGRHDRYRLARDVETDFHAL